MMCPVELSRAKWSGWYTPLLVAGVYALVLGVIAALCQPSERVRYDVTCHHLPVIKTFASQWPTPDLRNYLVATTPAYHLVLSLVDRFISDHVLLLRLTGSVFALLLAATMARQVGRIELITPLLVSLYVVSAGIYLLPEDAAWWLVAMLIGLCLGNTRNKSFYWLAGCALGALVMFRQTHAWAGLPIIVAACYGQTGDALKTRMMRAAVCVTPAVIALGVFVVMWGGLTPPAFQSDAPPSSANLEIIRYGGLSPTPPAFTLALLGVYGLFFVGGFIGTKPRYAWWIAGVCVGVALAIITPSTLENPFRDYGIWRYLVKMPIVGDRSIAFIALAGLGGGIVAAMASVMGSRDRAILGAVLFGFVIAHLPNPMIWQRYYEPFVLILLAYAASRVPQSGNRIASRARVLLPLSLALALLGVTLISLK